MRRGEKVIYSVMVASAVILGALSIRSEERSQKNPDKGIPFYSTASQQLAHDGTILYERNNCSDCHSLWATQNMMNFVPSPRLDGIGSLHDEQWFYNYFSASNPQSILPSRLKQKWRMPSYAKLPEAERRTLAKYMSSLKVKDWYLEQTRASEYEKLTGNKYHKP
jgi:Cytochrome c